MTISAILESCKIYDIIINRFVLKLRYEMAIKFIQQVRI
jgi:hypothetical protein